MVVYSLEVTNILNGDLSAFCERTDCWEDGASDFSGSVLSDLNSSTLAGSGLSPSSLLANILLSVNG